MLKLTLPAATNEAKYIRAASHPEVRDRLTRRVVESSSGCMEWQGAKSSGYGVLTVDKQVVYAHRLAYWLAHGPIEPGMVVDHICWNRACTNVSHLQLVSMSANSSRQQRTDAIVCKRGHVFDEWNTRIYVDRDGHAHRICRTCNIYRSRRYHAAH